MIYSISRFKITLKPSIGSIIRKNLSVKKYFIEVRIFNKTINVNGKRASLGYQNSLRKILFIVTSNNPHERGTKRKMLDSIENKKKVTIIFLNTSEMA